MTDQTFSALQAAVLPWSKLNHNDHYELTLKVAGSRKSFEAYLLRLLEIRYEEDKEHREDLPVLALDETSLTIRARVQGVEYQFHGKRSPIRPRRPIAELAMPFEEWVKLESVKVAFNLEYIDE